MSDAAQDFGAWVPGERALRAATGEGPLTGLRLAVKDLIDLAGVPTGGGNPDWAATQGPAAADAPAVARLRAAGARVVGKTVTDELAFSLEGENAHHGTPVNPRAPGRLPGGSSSGSAVAVAAGLADLALGTDTGGSVRVPASFCGVWAMRPTHGRVPLQGVLPFAPSYDTVGWFARDADLLATAGRVLLDRVPAAAPPDALAGPLKLRVATDALAMADAPVAAALQALAARLGCSGTVWAFEGFSRHECLQAYATLQGLEIAGSLGPWIRERRPRFGLAIAPRFDGALALDASEGEAWRAWRSRMARELIARLGPDEAWLVPAAPCVALARGADGEQVGDFYARALALGALAGHAGLPQVVMPLAEAQGLPVGLSFIAAPGNDERLLALALDCARVLEAAP
ncbi:MULTISPECIES: amidase [Ramlibacter]|uniref:Amidase n=1 Tax=Ramlibacter aquaticus TaxID=2780094 RepID=A0ABR9SI32_9BURK|nr:MULTISPECIES: amidase [Ramlibacter]MBE7942038.1 amidase [Ramlibacter aquaticus]